MVSCNHGRYDDRADNNPILRTVALTTFAAHRHSQPIMSFSVQLEATTGRFLRHVLPSFRFDYRRASRDAVHRVLEWYEEIVTSEYEAASLQIRFGYMMDCGNQGTPMRKQFEQLKHRSFRHRTSRRRRCSMWRTCCLRLNKLITNWEIIPCNCPGTLGIGKRKKPGKTRIFCTPSQVACLCTESRGYHVPRTAQERDVFADVLHRHSLLQCGDVPLPLTVECVPRNAVGFIIRLSVFIVSCNRSRGNTTDQWL